MLEHILDILDISMVKHAMTTDIPHTSQSTGIYQKCLSIVAKDIELDAVGRQC